MRVKSKVDLWIAVVIWAGIAIMAGTITMQHDQPVIGYAIGLPVIALLLWVYYGTYYELRDDYLYCRCGPFFEKIAYSKIKSVRLSRNMLSSMALSLDRIEIKQHGKGFILGTTYISPENREEFMRE
ncbi:MAG: PH domain-containing protein, partial [Bacillota bacterium]|nr:PH domain-containing protein [Bacillota bacterium]